MNIKLVASDLDGTIIDRDNKIAHKNFEAISKIHNMNIPFAVCTGKSYSVSKKICEQFNATYGIFGNGTQIIDLRTGKELLRNILSQKDLLFVTTLAKRFHYHIHLYTDNEIITEELKYMDLRNFIIRNENSSGEIKFKVVKDIINYIETNKPDVFSAVITTEDSSLESFQQLLTINSNIDNAYINKRGKYRDRIINKDYEYINVSPTHINKNEALNFLGEYLNIDKKDMMAIGDNVNDLEMVRDSGFGVAVSEAYDELKKVAKYVTKASVTDGAFAEAIYKYI
ncbi:MAG: HAD-IIB family hydrolase [Clostridia bacterium]|nr:HAD-IIB family hydrolase [Clostridia bacterium]